MSVEPSEAAASADSAEWDASTARAEAAPGTDEDLRDRASAAVAAAQDTLRHLVELVAAETQLAALSGVSMLLLVILAAALSIVGWAFVAGVVAYLLVMLGLPWPVAGLIMAAAHGVAVWLLWRSIVRLSRNLTMPALRRVVTGAAAE